MPTIDVKITCDSNDIEKQLNNLNKTLADFIKYAENGGKAVDSSLGGKGKKGVEDLAKGAKEASGELENMGGVLGKVAKGAAGLFAASQIMSFAKGVAETRKEFQSLEVSFSTLLGSASKGKKMFDDITAFATSTPMLEKDLAAAAQTMLGFGIAEEKVMPLLKQLGDISMGDAQKFQRLTLAFSQATSAGKLHGQDLLQMINAGFNPLNEIARTTGMSIAQLRDEMSKGAIGAGVLEQAIASATSEGGKFNGMLEAQSETLAGAASNLDGAIQKFQNALGVLAEPALAESTNAATEAVNGLTDFVEEHGEAIKDVAEGLAVAAGAYITLTSVQKGYEVICLLSAAASQKCAVAEIAKTGAVNASKTATMLATAAQKAFNAALSISPIGAIAVALGAAATIYSAFAGSADDAADAQERFGESAIKAEKDVSKLYTILNTASTDSKVYKGAQDELIKTMEDYGIHVDKEKTNLEELNGIREKAIGLIHQEGAERVYADSMSKAAETYNEKIDDFKKNIKPGGVSDAIGDLYASTATEEAIKNLDALTSAYEKYAKEAKGSQAQNVHAQQEFNQAIAAALPKTKAAIAANGGLNTSWVSILSSVRENIKALANAQSQYDDTAVALGNARNATIDAESATAGLSDAEKRAADNARYAKMSVQELADSAIQLQRSYEMQFNIHVNYDGQVPAWMQKQLGISKQMAGVYQNAVRQGRTVGKLSREETLVRMRQWTQAAQLYEEQKTPKTSAAPSTTKPKSTGRKGTSSTQKTKAQRENERKEERQELEDTLVQYAEEDEQLEREQQKALNDAKLEGMREGAEKELAELKREHQDRIDEIFKENEEVRKQLLAQYRQQFEAEEDAKLKKDQKNYVKKQWYEVEGEYIAKVDSDERMIKQDEATNKRLEANDRAYAIKQQQYFDEMLGNAESYTLRRAALESEIEKQIKEAQYSLEYAPDAEKENVQRYIDELKDKLKSELSKLDMEEFTDKTGLNAMLGNLEGYSDAALASMGETLKQIIANATDIKPEDLKTLQDALDSITRQRIDLNPFNALREAMKEAEKAADDLKRAEEELNSVAINSANGNILERYNAARASGNITEANKLGDTNVTITKVVDGKQVKEVVKLSQAVGNYTRSIVRADTANANVKKAQDGVIERFEKTGDVIRQAVGVISKYGDKFGKKFSKITKLAEDFTDGVISAIGGIKELVKDASSSMEATTGAAAEGMSNLEKASVILTIIQAAMQVAMALADFFKKDPYGDYDKLKAETDALLEAWDAVIQRKREYIQLSTTSSEEATKAFKDTIEYYKKSIEAAQAEMLTLLNSGASAGSHSIGMRLTNALKEEIDVFTGNDLRSELEKQAAKEARENGYNISGRNEWLAELTGEDWKRMQEQAPALFSVLTSLHEGLQEGVDTIIELTDGMKEAEDEWQEKILGTTFEGLYDNFAETLADMNASSEEFANNFEKLMQRSIINSLVANKYKAKLEKFFDQYKKAAESDGIDAQEARDLRSAYQGIYSEAMKDKEELSKVFDFVGSTSGTTKGIAGMTGEQADELNGRFAALQISGQSILAACNISNSLLGSLQMMAVSRNSFLEDIARYTKGMFNEWSSRIERIELNTSRL